MIKSKQSSRNAFTLIELLVVIAIIGILAAALFPAVSGAILRANATAFTNRGRNIVMSVINANLEREKDMLGVLWPHNMPGDPNYPGVAESTDPVDWVKNMLSPSSGRRSRLEGLDYSMFAGAGVPAASEESNFTDINLAWGMVFNLQEADSENALFLVTKNIELELQAETTDAGGTYMNLVPESVNNFDSQKVPFGDKMVVFVRKGGSASSMRPDLLQEAILDEDRMDVLMPDNSLNENGELIYPADS